MASQSQPGCLRNALNVFALQTRLLYVAALHNSLVQPKSHPGCQFIPGPLQPPCKEFKKGTPCSLVHADCWCQIPINLRLLTGLCSRVTPAICLRRLSNWGMRLNDSPAWIRPVTKDKTKSSVVEIHCLKTKWTAELGGRPCAGHWTRHCTFYTSSCFSIDGYEH